ncbi:site-2 protease family protein [Streptomyces sp. HB2AG]|uniref:site-2 protease family protein n=1 Tax=Streptomyces sp. HB2AG TaxID=2983400 RepID=UPI0022AAA01C|nr:site-2 protease family protein [Streptomyces sp. HB2AG]MCZ2524612.1 site-2 protease family protein [Streptomyces sp. HB2AG]
MKATFTLGRIAGIKVGVHWSVVVILLLLALGLAEGRLPEAHPGSSPLVYWGLAVATSLVFLASLLAHEMAHSVVARRNGVEVEDIVLWLLGGASRIRSEAPSPGAELRIAGVGPLVSLVLGALFGLAAWILGLLSVTGPAVEAVVWLAGINILLALFNSVPAAPLDGGRLLRAFLWWRTGDRLRATAGATAAGRAFGWLLVILGLWLFVMGDAVGGVWMALIGWFLVAAATVEGQQSQLRAALAGVAVRHAMTPAPVTVPAALTVAEFLGDPLYRYRHSAFPVTAEDGAPAGLVTLERVRDVPEELREVRTVGEVMLPLPEATVSTPGTPLADLLPDVRSGADNRVLVLDAGRLVGILSASDVSRTVAWLMSSADRGGGDRAARK